MGLVLPAKAGTYTTVAYGNLLVAGPYGFPPARERRENEKAMAGTMPTLVDTGDWGWVSVEEKILHMPRPLTFASLD